MVLVNCFLNREIKVKNNINNISTNRLFTFLATVALMLIGTNVFAQGGSLTVGGMAEQIVGSFENLTRLITAASYIAGIGFAIGSIMKFKQHKDNPSNIPIGTPIALLFIAAALLFLPTILGIAGATMFGGEGGETAGPTGTVF